MNVCILQMLYIDKIYVSEEINVNKTSESKECNICHYWHFLNIRFNLQPDVCNEWHDFLTISMNLSDIAVSNIKGADYPCIINAKYQSDQT